MGGNAPTLHGIGSALLAAGVALASGTALAQPTEIVTVEATRSIKTPLPSSVATIQELSLTGWVRINDLDLTTDAGVTELEMRIHQAAKGLCKEIDAKYPLVKGGDCVEDATRRAMAQAHKVIDARRAAASTR